MKHLLVGLVALLILPLAHAGEAPPVGSAQEQATAGNVQKAKSAQKKRPRAGKQQLPKGDLTHCLKLKTNEEIIRCAEGR